MGAIKTAVAAYYVEAGGAPPAFGTAALINTNLGIDVSTQYADYQWTGTAIQATVQRVSSSVNGGTITLTPDWTTKQWAWTVDGTLVTEAMKPKS